MTVALSFGVTAAHFFCFDRQTGPDFPPGYPQVPPGYPQTRQRPGCAAAACAAPADAPGSPPGRVGLRLLAKIGQLHRVAFHQRDVLARLAQPLGGGARLCGGQDDRPVLLQQSDRRSKPKARVTSPSGSRAALRLPLGLSTLPDAGLHLACDRVVLEVPGPNGKGHGARSREPSRGLSTSGRRNRGLWGNLWGKSGPLRPANLRKPVFIGFSD